MNNTSISIGKCLCDSLCLDSSCRFPSPICNEQSCDCRNKHQYCKNEILVSNLMENFELTKNKFMYLNDPINQLYNDCIKSIERDINEYNHYKRRIFYSQQISEVENIFRSNQGYKLFPEEMVKISDKVSKLKTIQIEAYYQKMIISMAEISSTFIKLFAQIKNVWRINQEIIKKYQFDLDVERYNGLYNTTFNNTIIQKIKDNFLEDIGDCILINPKINIEQSAAIRLRIKGNTDFIRCGIVKKQLMKNFDYMIERSMNKDCFLLSGNGEYLKQFTRVKISHCDTIQMDYNSHYRTISFENISSGQKKQNLPCELNNYQQFYFCVILESKGDQVQII